MLIDSPVRVISLVDRSKKSTVFCNEFTMTPSEELINRINSGEDWEASPVVLTSTLLILNPLLTKESCSAASSSHPEIKREARRPKRR